MTRETVQAKAVRYLSEARLTVVQVNGDLVLATCRGQGAQYDLGHDGRAPSSPLAWPTSKPAARHGIRPTGCCCIPGHCRTGRCSWCRSTDQTTDRRQPYDVL